MALSKIDVANMLTGAVPVANGGTALTSGFANGRTNNQMAPLIVNGDMAVAQRNTGTVAQADGSNEGYATVDRMQTTFGNSAGGTITTSRDTTAPTGFGQSMKFNVTGADTSLGSTHIVYTEHTLEAQVIRNSGWNYTSSSSYLTLSFQIRSSKTGTYCVYLQTNDGTAYQYTQEYTISSADTWEQKVLTFPGNSNLTFNNDNGKGLIVAWVWAVGSGRYGSAGSWTTSNAYGTSNQVNFLDSTDNIAYITGVQLEVGQFTSSTLPPFQHESYGDNLQRCHRYFVFTGDGSGYQPHGVGNEITSTTAYMLVPLSTPMRSSPSFGTVNTSNIVIYDGNSENTLTSVGSTNYSANSSFVNLQITASGGGIDDKAGVTVYSNNNAASGFTLDAEL